MTRHFGGRYFSWEQAIDFDALLAQIHSVDHPYRDFYLAAGLVVASDVVNAIGKHFAQPLKLRAANGCPKKHLVKQTLRDRELSVFTSYQAHCESLGTLRPTRGRGRHRAVRADYRDFLDSDTTQFAAVYADPPYTRDHYSRYYHVLETMALRDEPEVATTKSALMASHDLVAGSTDCSATSRHFAFRRKQQRRLSTYLLGWQSAESH